MRDAVSLADFSYSSTGKANAASPVTVAVQGAVTVTAVTFAPSDLARSKPATTALPASSEPSVAMRMCLYMVVLLLVCSYPAFACARRLGVGGVPAHGRNV